MAQNPTLTKLQTYLQQRLNLSNSTLSPETINVSMSKPVEKFYESLFEPNRGHCLEASSQQTEKMLPRMSFSIPFIYLELRRAHKEDCKKVRKSKAGKSLWLDYKIVYKILCFLESGYTSRNLKKRITLAIQRCYPRCTRTTGRAWLRER